MNFALSICGGGQRGLIPAMALADLEKTTGKLCRDIFSYCSGCSTGSLLAGAICAGIPASVMVDLYTNHTKDVFIPTGFLSEAEMVARGHKYDIANLMKLLEKTFGAAANWTMNDSPIGIMLAVTAANGHPWFIVKDGPHNAKTTGTVKLLEAMCASAAAITYFDAQRVSFPALGKGLWCSDGGESGVANPSYQTAVEMFEYDEFVPFSSRFKVDLQINPGTNESAESPAMKMITLGTGYYPVASDADVDPAKGLIAEIEFATDTLVDSSEDWVDQAVKRQWPGMAIKVDWALPSAIAMDDLSAIPTLAAVYKANPVDWKGPLGL